MFKMKLEMLLLKFFFYILINSFQYMTLDLAPDHIANKRNTKKGSKVKTTKAFACFDNAVHHWQCIMCDPIAMQLMPMLGCRAVFLATCDA